MQNGRKSPKIYRSFVQKLKYLKTKFRCLWNCLIWTQNHSLNGLSEGVRSLSGPHGFCSRLLMCVLYITHALTNILTNFYVTIIWWETYKNENISSSYLKYCFLYFCTSASSPILSSSFSCSFAILSNSWKKKERILKYLDVWSADWFTCWLLQKTTSLSNNLHSIKWYWIPVAYSYGEGSKEAALPPSLPPPNKMPKRYFILENRFCLHLLDKHWAPLRKKKV